MRVRNSRVAAGNVDVFYFSPLASNQTVGAQAVVALLLALASRLVGLESESTSPIYIRQMMMQGFWLCYGAPLLPACRFALQGREGEPLHPIPNPGGNGGVV